MSNSCAVSATSAVSYTHLLAIALFVVAYVIAELLPLATWFGSQTTALWLSLIHI